MFGKKDNISGKSSAMTYIGNGMKIEGKVQSSGPIRIDGEIQGDIDCLGEISIGPTAFISATIHAAKMVVNGRIEGNIYSTDQLEIMSQGHIIGNISTPPGKLIIHEGAIIEGQCITYESQSPKKVQITPEKKMLSSSEKKNPNVPEKKASGSK